MMAAYCHTDMRTNTGKIYFVLVMNLTSPWTPSLCRGVKEAYQPHPVLPDDQLKHDKLQEMLEVRPQMDID